MTKITVADLISKTEHELLQMRYSKVSMTYYRRIFKKIAAFFATRGEEYFYENVAMEWLDGECDFFNKEKRKELTEYDVYRLRAVRTLGSIARDEKIPVQYVRKIPEFTDESFMAMLNRLSEFSKSSGYAKSTQYLHRATATVLFRFMSEREISPKDITPQIISAFIRTYDGYSKKTMESKLYALRVVTKFLYDEGIADKDCSGLLPKAHAPQLISLPSVWSREDIAKLFAAIDRNNPLGKRDYAILLLAVRLGIRGCDIKRLKTENFDFKDKKEIRFVQSKTGNPVVLPLLSDVGWAVLNYLKDGRPHSDSPYVFVTHCAPYKELTEDNHMYNVVVKYARRAGIKLTHDQKYGIHSLRHTLATTLLEQNTDLKDISNILGQKKPDTTNIYLKKGISFLRECALDAEFSGEVSDVSL
jgi:site-specific recombinase XerD